MSLGEAEVIRRRAEAFLNNASNLLEQREWDLAVFCLEQYCQLILKYKLLVESGAYIRTHSLRRLIRELAKYNPKIDSLVRDEQSLHYVARLEEAYVAARYLPYNYEEREALSLHRFVLERFKPLVEAV
ncbi:MAG: HEPN domain-containing protein [Candidatus Caldarchaeum sp.]|nr:HEPN domain-containing protein [Candidatus Caldarchaeum sp.]MCS7137743.1 HEPN domain-containing protein [Candidatus Caldarchaeum sp.]MDW7977457.1 HEPN domain-containing protein [Candidatus Caldarchaeum sp.]MDW8359047.1 HEPN domain-containing protein [Candidatus Caldarchaeum sp.]